ncbi:MAG TPA: UDP-2,4-diacetamido-2,4,6-trideoxy-beta-L-altropyranose hydrolase [Sulfurimonas sp.]|nr:UDP-2,4-diacetamido-2,4,6-trideoxy-beta-L-altropyranose hydrolase [Sulfurimonas sp.]
MTMYNQSILILIRTDASLKIGSGHVMRCLSLAEALRDSGAEVRFVCRAHPGNLNDVIGKKEFKVHELSAPDLDEGREHYTEVAEDYTRWFNVTQEQDATETLDVLNGERPDWLIIDHYGLDCDWENRLRPHVRKLMVIDDLANRQHDCDLLLDQNYFRDGQNRYNGLVPLTCTQMLGPQYALLRPEFAEARKKLRRRTGEIRCVFVFFGGTDPENFTGCALAALSTPELVHLEVDVVLGKTNPNRASIERQVATRPNTNLYVQVKNIAELMVRADLALGAGGATTWERLCLGLPSIVTILSENQRKFSETLDKAGLQICLGNAKELSVSDLKFAVLKRLKTVESNRKQSGQCLEVVDGKGTGITKDMILKGIPVKQWGIRSASSADCEFYWHWVNDQDVRQSAFNSEPISWEDHQEWFKNKLNDPSTTLFLAESQFGPIGQVRFEKSGDHFVIDYSIGRQFRGLGLGERLLTKGIESFKNTQGFTLVGEVKEENQASMKIFQNLGFREISHSPQLKKKTRRFQLQLSEITR